MDGLKPGRIVYFKFDAQSATEVMRRRTNAGSIKNRLEQGTWPAGAQAHIGNEVKAGDVAPAMVTGVWGTGGCVNLKVFLDGCDEYWATSVNHDQSGATDRSWAWMYEGQATRGEAK
jgi:hypothetical protein